jgi:hypothetical protein
LARAILTSGTVSRYKAIVFAMLLRRSGSSRRTPRSNAGNPKSWSPLHVAEIPRCEPKGERTRRFRISKHRPCPSEKPRRRGGLRCRWYSVRSPPLLRIAADDLASARQGHQRSTARFENAGSVRIAVGQVVGHMKRLCGNNTIVGPVANGGSIGGTGNDSRNGVERVQRSQLNHRLRSIVRPKVGQLNYQPAAQLFVRPHVPSSVIARDFRRDSLRRPNPLNGSS